MQFIRIFGSLWFAIGLITVFLVILVISTSLESAYGTPFAQRLFYRASWFDLFLGFLGVNIVCSTLTRLPFRRRHTGFVVTHTGILLLLLGSLLSRLLGMEGSMMLFEGQTDGRIAQEGYQLHVATPENTHFTFDLHTERESAKTQRMPLKGTDLELGIYRVLKNASHTLLVTEGKGAGPLNRAIRLRLTSDRAGYDDSLWLIQTDTQNPYADRVNLGPATLKLAVAGENQDLLQPTLVILKKHTGATFEIPITGTLPNEVSIGDGEFILTDVEYFPHARVMNNELKNDPEGTAFNPAIRFEIRDAEDRREKHSKFALYPAFDSLHGSRSKDFFALEVILKAPLPADLEAEGPSLVITVDRGRWSYQSRTSRGLVAEGEILKGMTFDTGWMDFQCTVKDRLDHAVVKREVGAVPGSASGALAAQVTLKENNETTERTWVFENEPQRVHVPSGQALLTLAGKFQPVPFRLRLIDFRKVDYPGTTNAAAFESDVILTDPSKNYSIKTTISMNHPLDYGGFPIFQDSYLLDPTYGEASVFAIAKNPGITLIYSGAVIIFTGVLLLFYIRPFHRRNVTDA